MKKVYGFLFLLLVISLGAVKAQQDPLYSQYLTNPLIFNPAYAGLNNAFNASFSYRNQWAGFDGSPTTMNANSHLSLVDNKVGAGLLILQDKMGITKTTEIHALAAYKLELEKEMTLSFGMQFGLVGFRNDYTELNVDPDPAFAQNERASKPNVGVGTILKGNKFLVGLSIPRMLKSKFSTGGQDFELYNQHYYLFGSYVHYLGTRLRLKPSILFRGVKGAPISTDLNFNINIDTKYTAGIYSRNFKAYGLLLQGWFFEKYRFGYTFEVPTNKSVGASFTSHEITIGIKTSILNIHDRSFSEF
jgi:type IX secretion system PorP/SprF family membrane protein